MWSYWNCIDEYTLLTTISDYPQGFYWYGTLKTILLFVIDENYVTLFSHKVILKFVSSSIGKPKPSKESYAPNAPVFGTSESTPR